MRGSCAGEFDTNTKTPGKQYENHVLYVLLRNDARHNNKQLHVGVEIAHRPSSRPETFPKPTAQDGYSLGKMLGLMPPLFKGRVRSMQFLESASSEFKRSLKPQGSYKFSASRLLPWFSIFSVMFHANGHVLSQDANMIMTQSVAQILKPATWFSKLKDVKAPWAALNDHSHSRITDIHILYQRPLVMWINSLWISWAKMSGASNKTILGASVSRCREMKRSLAMLEVTMGVRLLSWKVWVLKRMHHKPGVWVWPVMWLRV